MQQTKPNRAADTSTTDATFSTAISFRFSAKYTDGETGLLYYGYRYYQPSVGRWLSGDPLGEAGGISLYVFVANSPQRDIDPWGLTGGNPVSIGPGIPVAPGSPDYFGNSPWDPSKASWSQIDRTIGVVLFKVSAAGQCIGGVIAAGGGTALATGGAATEGASLGTTSPVSVPAMVGGGALFVVGVDNAVTGFKRLVWNADYKTVAEEGISAGLVKAGVPKEVADTIAAGINNGALAVGAGYGAMAQCQSGCPRLTITIERAPKATVDDIMGSLAQGRSPGVKVVSGVDELKNVFSNLSQGGQVVPSGTYPGIKVRFPVR